MSLTPRSLAAPPGMTFACNAAGEVNATTRRLSALGRRPLTTISVATIINESFTSFCVVLGVVEVVWQRSTAITRYQKVFWDLSFLHL